MSAGRLWQRARFRWHTCPVVASAVLTLAPGCSPWRLRSGAWRYPAHVTDGDSGAGIGRARSAVRRECGPAHVPQLSCAERADLARYVLASLWTGHTSRRVYRPAGAGLPAQKGRRSPSGRPGSEPAPRRPGSTRPRPWNCWRPRRRSCARRCAAR